MNLNFCKLLACVTLLMFSGRNASAQVLTVTDTSDAHAMRIKSTINANKEIVDFIEHSLAQRKLPRHLRNLPLRIGIRQNKGLFYRCCRDMADYACSCELLWVT